MVNPVTRHVNPPTNGADKVHVPPGTATPAWYARAVNDVIGRPPSFSGRNQETIARESPALAAAPVGAARGGAGVTPAGGGARAPLPTEFVAATVNVKATPLDKLVTRHVNGEVNGGRRVHVPPLTATPPSNACTA